MAERIQCPNCQNANAYGDYEGPTCEVCLGDGFISSADDYEDFEGFDAGEWNNVPPESAVRGGIR